MMIRAQIVAIEYYLPEQTLDNEELARLYPEWTAQAIEDKTGVRTRHIAAPDETASDMAIRAAQQLFDRGLCAPPDIDFVLLCTQCPDYLLPTSACLIQDQLGIPKKSGAFDFNLGCSGFVYGLAVARGLIETGLAQNILLLTADTYSKLIHPMDRSARTLFGDAAAATLIQGRDSADTSSPLIGPFVFGTDGSGGEHLIVPASGMRLRRTTTTALAQTDNQGNTRSQEQLYMNGPAILTFSMRAVPEAVEMLLAQSGLTRENIDLFLFHQASKFMLEILRKKCKLAPERFVIDMADKGNTVGSTIPIALADAQRKGQLKPNAKAMLVGFGVGLSWGATLAVLPERI